MFESHQGYHIIYINIVSREGSLIVSLMGILTPDQRYLPARRFLSVISAIPTIITTADPMTSNRQPPREALAALFLRDGLRLSSIAKRFRKVFFDGAGVGHDESKKKRTATPGRAAVRLTSDFHEEKT